MGLISMSLMGLISMSFLLLIMFFHSPAASSYNGVLYPDYYKESCPLAEDIVRRNVEIAALREPRMAASLLRLHFHDCFVMGCDASVLLDSNGDIVSEKQAETNLNSARGFEVIDKIKAILEEACPHTVSCADLLALIARDAVHLRGGPTWEVELGRKDSCEASFNGANKFIPPPNSSLEGLIASFEAQGLNTEDLVALSGSHTIGKARCFSFRQRLYSEDYEFDQYKRNEMFRRILQSMCPESGRDNAVAPLDLMTSAKFDNKYYDNILQGKGLLETDSALILQDHENKMMKQVWAYASDQQLFFRSFVKSILKMGRINVLTGDQGQVRQNCRFVNTW